MERIEIEPASRLFAQQMMMGCLAQLLLAVAAHREMEPAVQLMRSQRQLPRITAQTIFRREDIRRVHGLER